MLFQNKKGEKYTAEQIQDNCYHEWRKISTMKRRPWLIVLEEFKKQFEEVKGDKK